MANTDRLTGLDASFLHLERAGAHMHVAAVFLFEGEAPPVEQITDAVEARLHLVPRYRQKLAEVPFGQGRPVWVDDPHFNIHYHVRHSALPAPGSDPQLRALAGRLFAIRLDRSKPLWEMHLVEGLDDDRFAIISKTHHALVDGVSGVDITSVLFSTTPDEAPAAPPDREWAPRPEPAPAQLLAEALLERATTPAEVARTARAVTRAPRQHLRRAAALASQLAAGAGAPPSPLNVPISPHRRYAWADADLRSIKAIKNAWGGTVNDVVLTSVSLAVGRYLRGRGHGTDGLVLKVMVPVSVRADAERGALGNRVAAMYAPLPVGLHDPRATFDAIHAEMADLKSSGQAMGAEAITRLADFAPPTILAQAGRLLPQQRFFNFVVTNVPGPQFPLYVLGRRMLHIFPVVPLAGNTALGVAIMSYDGHLGYGLLGDFDALTDLDDLAEHLREALDDLADAAGAPRGRQRERQRERTAT